MNLYWKGDDVCNNNNITSYFPGLLDFRNGYRSALLDIPCYLKLAFPMFYRPSCFLMTWERQFLRHTLAKQAASVQDIVRATVFDLVLCPSWLPVITSSLELRPLGFLVVWHQNCEHCWLFWLCEPSLPVWTATATSVLWLHWGWREPRGGRVPWIPVTINRLCAHCHKPWSFLILWNSTHLFPSKCYATSWYS